MEKENLETAFTVQILKINYKFGAEVGQDI
jgi:hypothetical protein